MSKELGLIQKYEVKKLTNPNKKMDCVVLEFDDPIARVGIRAFAKALEQEGYSALAVDLYSRCNKYDVVQGYK